MPQSGMERRGDGNRGSGTWGAGRVPRRSNRRGTEFQGGMMETSGWTSKGKKLDGGD